MGAAVLPRAALRRVRVEPGNASLTANTAIVPAARCGHCYCGRMVNTAPPDVHYTKYDDGTLVVAHSGEPAAALASRVHDAFRALVLDPEFPCVGARAAVNQGTYRFGMFETLGDGASSAELAACLQAFAGEYPSIDSDFTSFIACFDAPKVKDGEEFERLLWRTLEQLHAIDRTQHEWDPAVSRDPDDPRFSFSIGGRAFFVVGLAPSGERWARTFPWPLLAFNPHEQFERLREQGQFERIQEVVRERDVALEGSTNPNLADWGDHTEARQYSGRPVGPEWRCPARFDPA